MSKTQHVVMFSGGIGSWATAKRVVEKYGADNTVLLFSDVKGDNPNPHVGEDEDTYRFIDDAAANLGCKLVRVVDGRDIWQVFRDQRFLGNSRIAPCSHDLKQKPAKRWIYENTTPGDAVIYVGIDWSEAHRMAAVTRGYAPWLVDAPLLQEPYLTKQQMIDWAMSEGLTPPRLYALGFKHNNCGGGCVRAGQAQFKLLLDTMPERFAEWEKREEQMQDFLGVPVTILTRRVNGKKVPLSLTDLRLMAEDEIDYGDAGMSCNCTSSWFAEAEGAN